MSNFRGMLLQMLPHSFLTNKFVFASLPRARNLSFIGVFSYDPVLFALKSYSCNFSKMSAKSDCHVTSTKWIKQ